MSALSDLNQQLNEVNEAIKVVLTGGQEYKFNDMQVETWVKRGSLEQLRAWRQEIQLQIAALDCNRGFYAS